MLKIKCLMIVAGFLITMIGCLEKEGNLVSTVRIDNKSAFGLYKIQLTLLDADTKDPLPNLVLKLANNTPAQMIDPNVSENVTNTEGVVRITIAATPPVPQEFVFSFTDKAQSLLFQQSYISVFFINSVFKFFPDDATKWGKLYQGTAELILTRELKQIRYE